MSLRDVERWEKAWGDYVELLERCDRVVEAAKVSRHHGAGLRKPRKALDRARARIERLAPGFLKRIEKEA